MTHRANISSGNDYNHNFAPEMQSKTTLETVVFEEGIVDICSGAFSGCTKLSTVLFRDDAPTIASNSFSSVTAQALYPVENDTWTDSTFQNYGGTLTWTPYVVDDDGNILTDFNSYDTIPEETFSDQTVPGKTVPVILETEDVEASEERPTFDAIYGGET